MITLLQRILTIGLMTTLLLIAACGQTGPLYLPDDEDKTEASSS